jgi:hypothetical protein
LEDELAAEGAGEKGGRERVHLLLRRGQPRFKLIGQRKQVLNSAHDYLLFREWRKLEMQCLNFFAVDVVHFIG